MRRVVMWAIVGVLALLVQSSSAAPLPQMKASDEPVVEGPLTLADTKCDRKTRTAEGATVAVLKRCLRFYKFDPAMEADATSDYGVVWLQSNVKAKNGWCTKRAASDILVPDGVVIHAFEPKGRTEIGQTRPFRTALTTTANGTSSSQAHISQDWIAYPAQVRGMSRDEGHVLRVKWAGTTKDKLGFAGGAEISWAPDTPPDGLSYRLNFALGSPNTC